MIIFGFNLPFGKRVSREGHREEEPPHLMGWGFGWTAQDFHRLEKHAAKDVSTEGRSDVGGDNAP